MSWLSYPLESKVARRKRLEKESRITSIRLFADTDEERIELLEIQVERIEEELGIQ